MKPLDGEDAQIVEAFLEEIDEILDQHTKSIISIQRKAISSQLTLQEAKDSLTALKRAHRTQLIEILLTCIIHGKLDYSVDVKDLRKEIHIALDQLLLENILKERNE